MNHDEVNVVKAEYQGDGVLKAIQPADHNDVTYDPYDSTNELHHSSDSDFTLDKVSALALSKTLKKRKSRPKPKRQKKSSSESCENQVCKTTPRRQEVEEIELAEIQYTPEVNNGKRSYKCRICGKVSRDRTDIKRHLFIHTGESPFNCDYCGKKFKRKSLATLHSRRMHREELRKAKLKITEM